MISTGIMKCLLVVYFIICVACLVERNYPKALYWFSAALITTSVLWGMKWVRMPSRGELAAILWKDDNPNCKHDFQSAGWQEVYRKQADAIIALIEGGKE